MKKGDHLVTPRTGYSHHGLYIGNGEVIHYAGFVAGLSKGAIAVTSLEEFQNGRSVSVKAHSLRIYDATESVERAYSRLGEDWYNLLINNCEHFVNWCINGMRNSQQVNSVVGLAAEMAAGYYTQKASKEVGKTVVEYAVARIAEREVERQAANAVTSNAAKALFSTVAGTATTTALSTATATATASGTGTILMTGLVSTAAAPALLPIAAGIAVGTAVWNFFSD